MRQRFIVPSVIASVVVGAILSVNSWAAAPVYSSEQPPVHVQKVATPPPTPTATPTPAVATVPQRAKVTKPASSKPAATSVAISGNSLSIASIGFRAPIVEVGTTATNNIDVPSGMQVGRWTGSTRPGSVGAVFLDGHLGGIFAQLHTIKVGQIISISYGGATYNYSVAATETVPLAGIDMNKALSTYGGAAQGLNLMTCAGTYIPAQGTYDHRFVVYAVGV